MIFITLHAPTAKFKPNPENKSRKRRKENNTDKFTEKIWNWFRWAEFCNIGWRKVFRGLSTVSESVGVGYLTQVKLIQCAAWITVQKLLRCGGDVGTASFLGHLIKISVGKHLILVRNDGAPLQWKSGNPFGNDFISVGNYSYN